MTFYRHRFAAAALAVLGWGAVLGAPTGASAAIRTIDFEATSFSAQPGFWGVLGGISPVTTVTGSFTFDTTASPLFGPSTNNGGSEFETLKALRPYISFSADFGSSVILAGAASISTTHSIDVTDAIGSSAFHRFAVSSFPSPPQTLPGGTFEQIEVLALANFAADPFDGTSVPSVAAINSMTLSKQFILRLRDTGGATQQGGSTNITFSETVSPVPLPAALPLFLTALVGLGLIARRRRQREALA